MKFHLTIAYFGQRYHGWQRQAGGLPTVQEAVEQSAMRVFNQPIEVVGASRTDSGVHAEGQSAHVAVTGTTIPIERIGAALNARLATDIDVRSAVQVADDFDARRHARWKLYRYRVHNAAWRPVADWGRVWHYWRKVDDARIAAAAARLVGTHDFAGFAHASSQPRATTVRTIFRLDVRRVGDELIFEIEGDGFLYRQVRNTVGALVEIGRGRYEPAWIDEVLAHGPEVRRGGGVPSAPAQGLTLMHVRYTPHPASQVMPQVDPVGGGGDDQGRRPEPPGPP